MARSYNWLVRQVFHYNLENIVETWKHRIVTGTGYYEKIKKIKKMKVRFYDYDYDYFQPGFSVGWQNIAYKLETRFWKESGFLF